MAVKTEQDLPPDDRPTYEKALKAVQVHNYGYAISLLQGVVKRTPEFLEGRKTLRRAEIAATKGKKNFFSGLSTLSMKGGSVVKKDPLAAIEMAEKALETDPQGAPGNNLLKDAAKAAGFPEVAEFAMETLSEANPRDTKVLHQLAELYYEHGESEKAVESYNQILAINPNDLIANKRGKDAAAKASMKSGGWHEVAASGGKKDYRDLIKDKDLAVSLEQQNRSIRSEDEIELQLAEFHGKMEADPKNVDLARKIAGLYEQQPNFESAIQWYEYAAQLAGNADPGMARKVADLHLKVLDEHIKTREQFVAAAGESHEQSAQYRDEIAQLRKQKADALIGEARKRIERNPTDLQFRYELGEQLVAAGQFGEAIPELQKARNNPNARLRAMNLLAQCYSAKGMFDLAIKQFTDAAAEIPTMDALKKDVLYQLGLLHERQGHPDKTLECMKQIYDVDYGYLDVAERVEKSYVS